MEKTALRDKRGVAEYECDRLLWALEKLGAAVSARRYVDGDVIFDRGERSRVLCIVAGGAARLFGSYPGYVAKREATLRLLGPWDVFGSPIFTRGNFGAGKVSSAEAVTSCEVVRIPGVILERAMRESSEAAFAMTALMELTLLDYEGIVGCLLPRKTDIRLAKMLMLLARKFGKTGEDGLLTLDLRLTRQDLGAMIAATRESVNAYMVDLRRQGVLDTQRGRVVIHDLDRLAEIGAD